MKNETKDMKDQNDPKKRKPIISISHTEAQGLLRQGYFAMDLHCHSSYSYDVPDTDETSPERIIGLLDSKNLHKTITDHNNIEAYKYLKKKGIRIIPAMELTFKPKIARKIFTKKPIQTLHINIFGLNSFDHSRIMRITKTGDLDALTTYLKERDLAYTYNHPFYHEKKERLNWKVIPQIAEHYFDVIEINSNYSKGLNDITQRLAENLQKGIVAGSDNHTGRPGRCLVIAQGKNFKEFWRNIKKGRSFIVRKDMRTWDIVREASIMINQAFKARIRPRKGREYRPATTVKPFDRLLKSVTSGKLKDKYIARNIIQLLLQSINYTAVPLFAWRFHVMKNEEKAHRLQGRMHAITSRMRSFRDNLGFKAKAKISKLRYYGADLVESQKKSRNAYTH